MIVELVVPSTQLFAASPEIRANAAQEQFLSTTVIPVSVTHEYLGLPMLAIEVSAGDAGRLAAEPSVAQVFEDERVQANLIEGKALINAAYAAGIGATGAGVVVAVIDTGMDTDHPALVDSLLPGGGCFLSGPPSCPGDLPAAPGLLATEDGGTGHGSAVAGIITSNGAAGIPVGVAPDAQILSYRVLDNTGSGWTSDAIAALDDINVNHPEVDVVNMSLGGGLFATACDGISSYTSVLDALRARGTLVAAASGNDADPLAVSAPACVSSAISVGAVYDANIGGRSFSVCTDASTRADQVTCYSNSTPERDVNGQPLLDVLAPSDCAVTAALAGGANPCFNGTSAATPYVAGALAAYLSGGMTADEAQAALRRGQPVLDPRNFVVTPRLDMRAGLADTSTMTVNPGAGCNDGGPTFCTIQAALNASALGDTLLVGPGTYPERLVAGHPITLTGAGSATTIIDAGGTGRVLTLLSDATISDVTLQNGDATVAPDFGGFGGGILGFGTTTITNSTISGNRADGGLGGGIFGSGTTTITGSLIEGNEADFGGGIFVDEPTTITNSTISGNRADGGGGGIYVVGTTTITGSLIEGNEADFGGGIFVVGTTTIIDSTISGNRADGGGGGGILAVDGPTTITGSLIEGNEADFGGGIFVDEPTTIIDSTISGNRADGGGGGGIFAVDGTTTIAVSLIEGNEADFGGGIFVDALASAMLSSTTFMDNVATIHGGAINNNGGAVEMIGGALTNNTATTGQGGAALSVDSPPSIGHMTLRNVSLTGNTDAGGVAVFGSASEAVDARYSWWDDVSGPADGAVAGNVDFLPVCVDPACSGAPLVIDLLGNGSGTVGIAGAPPMVNELLFDCDADMCTADLSAGTQLTLAATASAGSTFAGWGDACASSVDVLIPLLGDPEIHCTATFNLSGGGGAPAPAPAVPAPGAPTAVNEPGGVNIGVTGQVTAPTSGSTEVQLSAKATGGSEATVVVPAGALPAGSTLVLGVIEDLDDLLAQAPAPSSATFVSSFHVTARDSAGQQIEDDFGQPVRLEFTVDPATLPDGALLEDLTVAFWDGTEWVEVPAVIESGPDGTVILVAEVRHFTIFSVMTRPGVRAFGGELAPHGFTLTTWGGGTIGEAVAAEQSIASLHLWRAGKHYGFIAGAPAFVNRPFRALFPDDYMRPGTVLVVVQR